MCLEISYCHRTQQHNTTQTKHAEEELGNYLQQS